MSYTCAVKLFNSGQIENAAEYFNLCKNHEDAADYLKYIEADIAADEKDWETAVDGFKAVECFLDANNRLDEALYKYVVSERELPVDQAITMLEQIQNKDSKVMDLLDMCKAVNTCAGEYRCVSSTYRTLDLSLYGASFDFYLSSGTVMVDPDFGSLVMDDERVQEDSSGNYTWYISTKQSFRFDFTFWVSETSAKLITDVMAGAGDDVFLFTR